MNKWEGNEAISTSSRCEFRSPCILLLFPRALLCKPWQNLCCASLNFMFYKFFGTLQGNKKVRKNKSKTVIVSIQYLYSLVWHFLPRTQHKRYKIPAVLSLGKSPQYTWGRKNKQKYIILRIQTINPFLPKNNQNSFSY